MTTSSSEFGSRASRRSARAGRSRLHPDDAAPHPGHGRDPARLRDALATGGVLCIADLDREDGSFHGPGFTGHDGFDRAELQARLERSGFEDVRFETVTEVAKETAAGVRVFPVFLAIATRSAAATAGIRPPPAP